MRGGTEQQSLLLVRALVDFGYNVEVCCYFEYDEKMVAEFKAAGASVSLLGWSRNIGAIKFIRALYAIFRSKEPAVVHVQYMTPGLLPILSAKMAKVPVIIATVNYPGTPYGFIAKLLLHFGAVLTNCFTCVSEAVEKSWFGDSLLLEPTQPERIKGRRHLTIHNAIDIESVDNAIAERSPTVVEISRHLKNKIIIGTVARLSNEKGIDILLKTFANIRKTELSTHLLIVGGGSQHDYLHKLAKDLDVDDACSWLGRLPWNEAMGCLNIVDIVAVPSRFEGFGLTAVEAMACSKPVVASNVDGLAEIIQDGVNGFLVPEGDAKAFAECVLFLLKDEEKRKSIGIKARKHVKENYSYKLFRDRCKALYEVVGR